MCFKGLNTYVVNLSFKTDIPQFKTHELSLGFHNEYTDIPPYQKIYFYKQNGNTIEFTFSTKLNKISRLCLSFQNNENDLFKEIKPSSLAINSTNLKFTATNGIKTKDAQSVLNLDEKLIYIDLETPFSNRKTSLSDIGNRVNFAKLLIIYLFVVAFLYIIVSFIEKILLLKELKIYFNVHDIAIIGTLYLFNAMIILFFVRDFDDAITINLTCLLVCGLEFIGLYLLLLTVANKKWIYISITSVFMLVIVGQLMCMINSLSYISLVSAGNINLDNLSVVFNEYNYKFPLLLILAIALFISSQQKIKKEITFNSVRGKLYLFISVFILISSFLLNTLPNGTRIEHYQSPVLGWTKTNIIRYFPNSAHYISPITTSYLTDYPENNFGNILTFYNDTVYEKELDYPLLKPVKKPNVIIFFVENFTAEFIDTYRETPLNIMPFMSNLQNTYSDKQITLVRNYFNHSATTIKNIRSQLNSGFQYDSVVHNKNINEYSLPSILNKNGYDTYFVSPKNKDSAFNDMLDVTGFTYKLTADKTTLNGEEVTTTDCKSADCQDDEIVNRLKDVIHYHKFKHAHDNKPYFISLYNIGTHLNQRGRLSFHNGDNIILNRNYTLDFDLRTLIDFYYSELSEDTIMILTADHSIIPGDYDSEIIDFDQEFIVNEVPFYIFQPYYNLPKTFDVYADNGFINSLATAPTILHMLKINPPNYFLGCSLFEKKCRRAVNLSKYAWYIDDGLFFEEGNFENGKKYKPREINNLLQEQHPEEDFRLYNQYRKAYINIFD